MDEVKKIFENYIETLFKEIQTIDSCFELWIHLQNKKVDRLEEMNLSPAFFGLTIHSLLYTVIISLTRLYDSYKYKDRSDKNLIRFINFNQSNICIFPTDETTLKKHNCLRKVDNEMISEHKSIIREQKEVLDNLFIWRDKSFAHFDSQYFGQEEKVAIDHPINIGDIKDLIKKASSILNEYSIAYFGENHQYRATNYLDVDNTLEVLHEYLENRS